MDIETLKKMQETEKALKIHNITTAPQEAIDSVQNDLSIAGTKIPSYDDITRQPEKTKSLINESTKVIGMDEDLKKVVEEQAVLISKQARLIYELQSTVNEVIKEIKKMQSTVPTKNPNQRQQVLKAEDKVNHPRSGGYNSSDVSVEKFFYSGSK